jgi:hypothetical protein
MNNINIEMKVGMIGDVRLLCENMSDVLVGCVTLIQ